MNQTDSRKLLTRRSLLQSGFGAGALLALPLPAFAAPPGFEQWRDGFRARALAKGISDATYTRVMGRIEPDMSVFRQMQRQPEFYEQIGKQFEQDWSVKLNQIIEPNVEPQVAKLTAMYAAGDPVDVSQAPVQYLSSYIDQGIATPIDGLPGVEQYVKDFTPFTRAIAQRDGKTWGLPYFSTVWAFIYND